MFVYAFVIALLEMKRSTTVRRSLKDRENETLESEKMRNVRDVTDKTIMTVFLFIWSMALWMTAIYKLRNDGLLFFHYFTNWNWTIQIIFFTLEFGAIFSGIKKLRIINLSFVFWIVNGTTWLVFWLVFFMIRDNQQFLLKMTTLEGGPYEFWVVLYGHVLFHILISIVMLIFIIFQKKYIDDSVTITLLQTTVARDGESLIDEEHEDECIPFCTPSMYEHWSWKSVVYLLFVTLTPIVILGIYCLTFDIHNTYGITTNMGLLFVCAIVVVLIFNTLYVYRNMVFRPNPKSELYRSIVKH